MAEGKGDEFMKAAKELKDKYQMKEEVSKLTSDLKDRDKQLAIFEKNKSAASSINYEDESDEDTPQIIPSIISPSGADDRKSFAKAISNDQVVSMQQHQALKDQNALLKSKMQGMEQELSDLKNKNEIYKKQLSKLQVEIKQLEDQNQQMGAQSEGKVIQNEDLEHIRDILQKFIVHVPITSPGNEQMLQIVLSMLFVSKQELENINEQ